MPQTARQGSHDLNDSNLRESSSKSDYPGERCRKDGYKRNRQRCTRAVTKRGVSKGLAAIGCLAVSKIANRKIANRAAAPMPG